MSRYKPSPPGAFRRHKSDEDKDKDDSSKSKSSSDQNKDNESSNMDEKGFPITLSSSTSAASLISGVAILCIANFVIGFGAGFFVSHLRNRSRGDKQPKQPQDDTGSSKLSANKQAEATASESDTNMNSSPVDALPASSIGDLPADRNTADEAGDDAEDPRGPDDTENANVADAMEEPEAADDGKIGDGDDEQDPNDEAQNTGQSEADAEQSLKAIAEAAVPSTGDGETSGGGQTIGAESSSVAKEGESKTAEGETNADNDKENAKLRVSKLFIYPIKGCAGTEVESAIVTEHGLKNDRMMMVVDFTGRDLNQKKYPHLVLARATVLDNGDMRLEAPNTRAVEFTPQARGTKMIVTALGSKCEAVDQGDTAATFFANLLEIAGVRLVRMREGFQRNVQAQGDDGGDDFVTSFADKYPVLLANEASRRQVEQWAQQDVSMVRFRPNLVVDGGADAQAFDEDAWTRLKAGVCEFDVAAPCTRCKVVTVDPDSGEYNADDEPVATLRKFRRFGDSVRFGQNIVPRRGAGGSEKLGRDEDVIRVDDLVDVLCRTDTVPQPDEV